MPTIAPQDSVGQAASLADLLLKIQGTNSSSTTTPNISQAGIDAMLQEILGGSQGLAAVASGQKSAGGYNSSTNQLLINDLIARTTAQVAKASAGSTTTQKTGGMSGKTAALAALATAAAKAFSGGSGGSKSAQSPQSFNTSKAEEAAVNKTSDPIAALNEKKGWTETSDNNSNVDSKTQAENLDQLGVGLMGDGGALSSGASSDLGGITDSSGGIEAAMGSNDSQALADAQSALDSSNTDTNDISQAVDTTQATGGDFQGIDLSGGDTGGGGGGDLGYGGSWVICTELNRQGILPDVLYAASALRVLELSEEVMVGYHSWAIPYTRLMRKSKFWTKFATPWAVGRCNYLLGRWSFLGCLTVQIGEPLCAFLSLFISAEDWRNLYGNSR